MNRQLCFPYPMNVTKIYPNGIQERLRYGQYEAVMITKENGYPVYRTSTLAIPTHPVTEVELVDGSKIIFDEPLYCISEKGYYQPN